MATEIGMLHPLRLAAPGTDFIAANEAASCRYMKMITLPKLRDAVRDGVNYKDPDVVKRYLVARAGVPVTVTRYDTQKGNQYLILIDGIVY